MVLRKYSALWLSKLKALSADATATKEQVKNAQNKYRHVEVKDALVEMFCGKCAYCESKITAATYGAIEHFFPKSSHIDLTFEWQNLLLSCDRCNDPSHKGTKFPLDDQGNPLLIDPFALLRLAQSGDKEARDLLQESCDPSAEYSAFALACIYPHLND